jgi:hypothetical protein
MRFLKTPGEPSAVPASLGWLRKLVFGIPRREWTFNRRGFPVADPVKRQHLERIIRYFIDGYHWTLEDGRPESIFARLSSIEPEFRGFAYEGAALCFAAFDILFPGKRNRWVTFQQGLGEPQSFLMHVGYGLALAQLKHRPEEALTRLSDPGERWLAIDGYGFHSGYFHWRKFLEERAEPLHLTGYARRAFDQGLGRAMWFGCGADVDRVVQTVGTFAGGRRRDLWSGIGVAATFAGGVGRDELTALREASNGYEVHLQQGSIFAIKLRQRAGTLVAPTELACETLCEMTVPAALAMVDAATEDLPPDGAEPGYEVLRQRVQHQLAATKEFTT